MPNVNVSFAGYTLIIPNAYYADNTTNTQPTTPPVQPPIVLIGYSYGGASGVPYTFANGQQLVNFMRGGPAAALVPFITNPSPSVGGAGLITLINVGNNTQSTYPVNNASGHPVYTLTSVNYGPPSNLLQVSFQTSSLGAPYGYNITVADQYAGTSLTGVDVGIPFQVAYTGAASGGLSYTATATGFTLTSSASGAQSITFPLGASGYPTISNLVSAINGTSYWTAQLISATQGLGPSSGLDAVSGAMAPVSGGVPQYAYVSSYAGDVAFWFNQFAQAYATATFTSQIAASGGLAVPSFAPAYFTGASGGAPTTSSYASGFNAALTTPAWVVVADSNSAAVQALGAQHAQTASTPPYGSWRRFFTGSSLGDSVTQTQANASALDSATTCYFYPGIIRTNTITGSAQVYPGYYAAAAAAGIAAGNQIALPLTNKALTGSGVEIALNTTQINNLQQYGVCPIALSGPNTNVPTIVSDLTTWQVDSNPSNVFTQQIACRWWTAYSLVNTARQYVGTIAALLTEAAILNGIKATLNSLIYTGGGSNGVLSSWDSNSLLLTYTGSNQVAAVAVNVTLVGQNRFITITANLQPLNISISLNATAA